MLNSIGFELPWGIYGEETKQNLFKPFKKPCLKPSSPTLLFFFSNPFSHSHRATFPTQHTNHFHPSSPPFFGLSNLELRAIFFTLLDSKRFGHQDIRRNLPFPSKFEGEGTRSVLAHRRLGKSEMGKSGGFFFFAVYHARNLIFVALCAQMVFYYLDTHVRVMSSWQQHVKWASS